MVLFHLIEFKLHNFINLAIALKEVWKSFNVEQEVALAVLTSKISKALFRATRSENLNGLTGPL